jgi:serine/threonine-protein phosphatase 2A regulatory subunit B''
VRRYGSGTLTRAFLARVFQQCLTYDGEMDYKTYLDLVLALENRRQPAALAYLFRVLDVNCQGYLDAFTLNYFFKVSLHHSSRFSPFGIVFVRDYCFKVSHHH